MSEQGKPSERGAPDERMELKHEAVPGYKPVFYIVLAIGLLYLVAVFLLADGSGAH